VSEVKPTDQQELPLKEKFARAINFRLMVFGWIWNIFLLLMLLPSRPWTVEIFATLLNVLLLPSIPILLVYSFKRMWRYAALWLLPSVVFVLVYGALFVPDTARTGYDGPGIPLSVMTFNLNANAVHSMQNRIDMIRESGADIVALQEVSDLNAYKIDSQLSDIYPYRILYPLGPAGSGILSKYPLSEEDVFHGASDSLFHTKTLVDIDGIWICVISAHPPPPLSIDDFRIGSDRYNELHHVLGKIPGNTPALIMGDFNMSDTSVNYSLMTDAGFHDAFREVGWGLGWTFPIPVPLLRIDYIWHSGEFMPVAAHNGGRSVSDHLPVIATFVLVPRAVAH